MLYGGCVQADFGLAGVLLSGILALHIAATLLSSKPDILSAPSTTICNPTRRPTSACTTTSASKTPWRKSATCCAAQPPPQPSPPRSCLAINVTSQRHRTPDRQGTNPGRPRTQLPARRVTPVGAGLPAMRAPRSFSQTEVMPSQASQLPHSILVSRRHRVGFYR